MSQFNEPLPGKDARETRSKDELFSSPEAIAFEKGSVALSDVDKQRMGKDAEGHVMADVPSETDYH